MIAGSKDLGADDIRRLLHKLDDVLTERSQSAVLYVVGGANMALAVSDRRSTTDVDAHWDKVWVAQ
ncbi:hypothetical protein SAMN04489806_1100 [Paramicrobacterium humi]|uniref:Uncharacterized protein n=1 Tax=Paramicrobacterium humi TaxID=640635 RepID=A0A1H4KBE3_9MICO|nr:hypothetical protein [Microbacterium humi]SEB55753.1 hypothetical protein SAMN04489806_1100 [Microbacterium humi]